MHSIQTEGKPENNLKNENISNRELAEELKRPIIRKF